MKLHVKKVALAAFMAAAFRLLYLIGNRPWMRVNRCDMTYMYRFMSFMRIDVDLSVGDKAEDVEYPFSHDFSGYSTILYGEGEYAINFMKTGRVSGIPVIFVPGNAGSSRQVRSLGSVLQNKTESRNLPFIFDVFSVDFNEELSGLSGMYLERQIKYLELAVKHIWGMYSSPPHGIIFVGHSMGGIVIRSLLRSFRFDPTRIAFIITLGTPHRDPPVVFDWYMKNVYNRMHDSWRERGKELTNLLVLSVSGGLKDQLVPEQLTLDQGIRHVSTTAVDGIELETDHLCIVWCNQLVRRISRLLIEYAYDPNSFHERADTVVQQLFDADGLLRELTRTTAGASIAVNVKNESLFIKNDDEDTKEFELSYPKNSWIFVARSSGTSLWAPSGEAIYSLSSLRRTFYTLVHSSVATQLSVHLRPQKFFKAIVLQEDLAELRTDLISHFIFWWFTFHITAWVFVPAKADRLFSRAANTGKGALLQVVYIGLFSLLKGCFTSLWEAEFEGRQPAVLLPIHFGTPAVAVVLSLELVSCSHTNEWFAKIEFRSQDLRRVNSLGSRRKIHLVGHLLHKEDTKADAFFVLNQRCRFHARLDFSFLDTLVVMFRMYGSIVPYMLAIYIHCTLSISIIFEKYVPHIQDHIMLFSTLICHMLIIYWNNVVDWFTLLISSLLISCSTFVLQKLAVVFIRMTQSSIPKRSTKSSHFDVGECVVVATSLFINYAYNGFFALLIIVFVSLFELIKTMNFPKAFRLSSFWLPFLLTVLHFYVILIYVPFGVCSMWNIIKYGLFAVYEDPARVPAYILIFLKSVRIAMDNVQFLGMQYVSLIVLAYTALIQPFTCIAQLGFSFITVIGLSWFTNQSELKQKK